MASTREQAKRYYEKNKQKVLERMKTQRAKQTPEEKAKRKAKREEWQAANRDKRNAYNAELRKKQDAEHKAARAANSEMVSIADAALILGIATSTFKKWVYAGQVPYSKMPGGSKILVKREDVENLKQTTTEPTIGAINNRQTFNGKTLKPVKTVGEFIVPEGFDLITEYSDLTEYTLAFAAKKIGFLLLIGSPGSGKSRQMKADLEGKHCTWIDNHATNLGLYCKVYESNHRPVVLDDVNHFLKNLIGVSLCKALSQTEEIKNVSWESTIKLLEERDVPRKFQTKSPLCLIGNTWDGSNSDLFAIQDRSLPVCFCPSAEKIHARVIELGWCKEKDVIRFIGDNLPNIPQPSMREYYLAGCYKKAGMDWKKKLLSVWER